MTYEQRGCGHVLTVEACAAHFQNCWGLLSRLRDQGSWGRPQYWFAFLLRAC